MSDFDRVFETHYTATDLFINRVPEHAAFAGATRHQDEQLSRETIELGQTARRNVLTFYGIGGIGKTELSKRLDRWVLGELSDSGDWRPRPRFDRPVRTVRFDFHGSRAVAAVDIVLGLRAAVADLGHRFPAFDLGLAAWWAFGRPGTPLPDLSAVHGFDVRTQISDTLNDLLSDAGARFGIGPLTVRSGIRLVDAIRDHRLRGRTLRECIPLRALVDEARRAPSPYVAATLAGLLSWDLANLPPAKRPLLVAFADAFEYVQRDGRDQERLFNRIVHLTPGVLWVVTSHNRLDWNSPGLTGLLPATGPAVWPGLSLEAVTDPRQHLVGDLSDIDVERYLAAASSTAGNPELTPDAVRSIRQAAHGLPLYLDLSMAIARGAAGDSALSAAEFGRPLPELVARVFATLPDSERELARTASLIPRFDPELLAQATGGLVGDAYRLCEQTLVTRDHHPLFPYRLHDAVRAAIVDEPVANRGAWAAADRAARVDRLIEALRERHAQVLSDSERRLDVLEITASLCAARNLAVPWLCRELFNIPGFTKTATRLPPADTFTWSGQLFGIFGGWRDNPGLAERIVFLERYAAGNLSDDLSEMTRRRLAYAYRTASRFEDCLRTLSQLLSENPGSKLYRYQVALTLHALADYSGMHAHLARYPLGDATAEQRLRSDLAFDRGQLAEAAAGAEARAAHLRADGRHRTGLENHVIALWRKALIGHAEPAECEAAYAEADQFGVRLNMRAALSAKAITLRGDAARAALNEAAALLDATSARPSYREWSAGLIYGLRCGDRALIEEIRTRWLDSGRRWSQGQQVIDRLCVYAGYPARYPPFHVGDGDSAAIDRRWHSVIAELVAG
ncbi:hypothetical protein AB0F46_33695 [Streptomyces sp. NPDC026665]|uniref:hypothetical protein n=1 Tax=Streptomyces sp. NPDC026665 TaxID=3154798 RepID=UPI0033F2BC5C